jgi:hypothetical protein
MVLGVIAGALVVAAIASSLAIVGGPETARHEREDRMLKRDLITLAGFLSCKQPGQVLPKQLERADFERFCNSAPSKWQTKARLIRPEITYTRLDDHRFRLCGQFHDLDFIASEYPFDRNLDLETGCLEDVTNIRDLPPA